MATSINHTIITTNGSNPGVCGFADRYITATNYIYDKYTQRVRIHNLKMTLNPYYVMNLKIKVVNNTKRKT